MLKAISDFLSGKASLFIILTAVVTFFYPQLFAWVKGDTQTIILGIIMLTMGLTMTPKDFKLLAQRPFDILIGAAAQFTIMPLVAFSLSWLFSQVPAFAQYSTAMAIGIILVGCCPGGVSTDDFVAKTMESRIVPGLYLCGEVLDIDADTGGYNLQLAFATGALAGRSAAKSL